MQIIVEKFQNASLILIEKILQYYDYYDCLDKYFCNSFFEQFLEEHKYEDMIEFVKIENDFELGCDNKYPYIQFIDKNELSDFKKLSKIIKNSLYFIIFEC